MEITRGGGWAQRGSRTTKHGPVARPHPGCGKPACVHPRMAHVPHGGLLGRQVAKHACSAGTSIKRKRCPGSTATGCPKQTSSLAGNVQCTAPMNEGCSACSTHRKAGGWCRRRGRRKRTGGGGGRVGKWGNNNEQRTRHHQLDTRDVQQVAPNDFLSKAGPYRQAPREQCSDKRARHCSRAANSPPSHDSLIKWLPAHALLIFTAHYHTYSNTHSHASQSQAKYSQAGSQPTLHGEVGRVSRTFTVVV